MNPTLLASGVAIFALGTASGYAIAAHRERKKFDIRIELESQKIREVYETKERETKKGYEKIFGTIEEVEETIYAVEGEVPSHVYDKIEEYTDYNKVPMEYEIDVDDEVEEIFDEPSIEDVASEAEFDLIQKKHIEIVSWESYLNSEYSYDAVSLMYDPLTDIVSTDVQDELENPIAYISGKALNLLKDGNVEGDCLYVLNHDRQTLYEVYLLDV